MSTTEKTGSNVDPRPSAAEPPAAFHRDALNLPNLITLSRLVLAVVLFCLIYIDGWWRTAAVLFVAAAATDALDGYIARRYGLITVLGRILDPFVDKIIVCGAFVFLLEHDSGVNAWMVIIVIGREMFVSSLRGFLEQQGKDFSANWVGKSKMLLQCVAVTASLLSLSPEVHAAVPQVNLIRDVLLWTAVGVTAYSGWVYAARAVQLLRGR
jgi:CDP-diacylglycerol--glycerol-3-phosphate 3-phosphatidyltransferase